MNALMGVSVQEYGRDWVRLSEAIPDKTVIQIKNYYQNYKGKLGLDRIELPPTAIHPSSRRRRSTNQAAADVPRTSVDVCPCSLRISSPTCAAFSLPGLEFNVKHRTSE